MTMNSALVAALPGGAGSVACADLQGLLVKADPAAGTFTLLVPVPYDPANVQPAQRLTCKLSDGCGLFSRTAVTDPGQVQPGTVGRLILIGENCKALQDGQPFTAERLEIEPDMTAADPAELVQGASPCLPLTVKDACHAEVNCRNRSIPVTVASGIYLDTPLQWEELVPGCAMLRVTGSIDGDFFLCSRVLATAMTDPRKPDDPKLPRVLVIGDSISMNYHDSAQAALKGKANYHRIDGNSGDTVRGNTNLEIWLGPMEEWYQKWDVVLINHGLHDLKQPTAEDSQVYSEKHQVDPDAYRVNWDNILKRVTQYPFKIIVVTTTPVPNNSYGIYGRRKDEDLVYNQILLEVVKKYPAVEVLDLNAVVRNDPAFDNWRKGNNVHFNQTESAVLGNAVAAKILQTLQQ